MKAKINQKENLTPKIMEALKRATQRVIVETKATGTYLVVSDGRGGIKKIPAKDL